MNNEYGLVLCGGGGLGAAQIGVWQALREAGIEKNIKAVSGTSVGALNAVLFAIGDLEYAKSIWYSITRKTLLSPNKNFVKSFISNRGLCSRAGLEKIINEVDLSKIRRASVEVYVTVYNKSLKKTEYFLLNDRSKADIKRLLLASSAIPLIYKAEEFEGFLYCDGSKLKSGNTPIKPIYDKGIKNIIVSSLNYGFDINNIPVSFSEKIFDGEKEYPDCGFTAISPKNRKDGNHINILSFSPSAVRGRMTRGYSAAREALSSEEGLNMADNTSVNMAVRSRIMSIVKTEADWEDFVSAADFKHSNMRLPTLGGKIFYENVVELFGWKIQRHTLKTPLTKNHYRILDKNDVRRAWVLSCDDLIAAIEKYIAAKNVLG